MKTNGCTYGKLHNCGNHGTRTEVSSYQKPGQAYRTARWQGAMRKYAGWRYEPALPGFTALPKVQGGGDRTMVLRRRNGVTVKVA